MKAGRKVPAATGLFALRFKDATCSLYLKVKISLILIALEVLKIYI